MGQEELKPGDRLEMTETAIALYRKNGGRGKRLTGTFVDSAVGDDFIYVRRDGTRLSGLWWRHWWRKSGTEAK